MLIEMKEMLEVAQEHKFAVPAFNAGTGQLLTAMMESAEEKQAPVIMAIHPDELSFLRDSFIASVLYEANHTKIPMVLHLDHGSSYEQCIHAIQIGFNSVMIDGSHLSFEKNIALTKKVVEAAHPVGVFVEGELGTIGNTGNSIENGTTEITYTNPEDAKEFVEKTGVDSLAIAIGTAHGIYPKGFIPKLKLDLITEIKNKVNVPLVLHGGSSNPDKEIADSVKLGISKINISSDIKFSFMTAVQKYLAEKGLEREPNVIYPSCIRACRDTIEQKMALFNDLDKVKYFKL
ncbi:fructose-bisphosphate aldolase class II [Sporomusaceae bacterium BoRhaA]|uniref:ketose-bisphosphate aldolase n=1 Tax=Pelorhabdus rhamnosifermentans TaxID=2772457 RepID=UPI001C05ED91|nr:ketose-bisphosphate aldolase [Pelorhabdus rhamnosifermentans]MBU2701256.1 fructose-bisphosphate aldolase class II [Pelorhabdus rhamnosifermentans]